MTVNENIPDTECVFCPSCGEKLPKEAEFCTKCGTRVTMEYGQTVGVCRFCNKDIILSDRFCRHCGIDYSVLKADKELTDEAQIEQAHIIIEKLIAAYNANENDNWALANLLTLLHFTPMYLAVEMDISAILGGVDPLTLKPGDTLTSTKDTGLKILTANAGSEDIVPIFTDAKYANHNVVRLSASAYLPILRKMGKHIVVNAFNSERFLIPYEYIPKMIAAIKAQTPPYSDLKEGTVIDGKYKLIKQIGADGFYRTYTASDVRFNKIWTVKAVVKNVDSSKGRLDYSNIIRDEAIAMSKYCHDLIAKVVDIIDTEDYLFIVTDDVSGKTLENIVSENGAQPQEMVLDWAKQICDILIYFREQNPKIVHRDIKPANFVLRTDGRLLLTDCSIARKYVPGLTQDEKLLGTKGYAAPEQFGSAQTDCRSDIYGLGATMLRLLTGVNPATEKEALKPIRTYNKKLSKSMEKIVSKCLCIDAGGRYQTPEELLKDLKNVDLKSLKRHLF